ncbi:putative UDP-glucose glucosyltransferase [Pistacia vera]|uniref:putative UDP-glucose glucosyltransferase n=1 Tax=Pistacia vera TaxID=55513 RepID=UPI001262D919|nr:putative UDP-glucose glucosyltransferase [Pistacia vera]
MASESHLSTQIISQPGHQRITGKFYRGWNPSGVDSRWIGSRGDRNDIGKLCAAMPSEAGKLEELIEEINRVKKISLTSFGEQPTRKFNRILLARDSACLEWLDQQQPNSVIYVAFGSFTLLHNPIPKLALGLEPPQAIPVGCWPTLLMVPMKPSQMGLKKGSQPWENGGLGAAQKVLSHPSIACFVSHCGWNSTWKV